MSWLGVEKPISGRVIRTRWGRGVVESLDWLYARRAPFYGTYLAGDIAPDRDVAYDIGKPLARIREIHARDAYATTLTVGDLVFDEPAINVRLALKANHRGLVLVDLHTGRRYRIVMQEE